MKKLLIALGVVILVIVLFVIFKKDKPEEQNFVIGEANVSSVELVLEESFPIGVRANVEGTLPDSCTVLGDVLQTRDSMSGDFVITLQTKRPIDEQCAQVLGDFETSFLVDGVDGLSAGEYGVVVNGVRQTFTFQVDNFISDFDPLK